MRTPILVPLALLLSACGTDFELQSEIRRVRVLAVRAEPAEVLVDPTLSSFPDPVSFSALAVTPDARPVTVTYALCRATSTNPYDGSCPGSNSVPLPQGVLSFQDPNVQAVLNEALTALNPGGGNGGPPDPNDSRFREALEAGIPFFIGYEATDGSGTPEGTERGIRRLTARAVAAANRNPEVADILRDGAPLSGPLPPGTEVSFQPVLAEGSAEVYETDEGPRTEQVFYSWYATGEGEVRALRSLEPVNGQPGDPTTDYETPAAPASVTFYVVARDGRGGVGWLTRTVDVGP